MSDDQRLQPFHFRRLGYQRNPFGTLTDEEWAAVTLLPEEVEAALASTQHHLQLLGEMGRGKSSCLVALADWFQRQELKLVYEYLPPGTRRFQTDLARLDLYLLDEAQRLSPLARRRLLQAVAAGRVSRLFISSHQDLTPWFRRRRLPLTTVNLDHLMTPQRFRQILQRRLDQFALPGQPQLSLSPEAITLLFHRFGDDLRRLEWLLYEFWQRQIDARQVTPDEMAAFLADVEQT